MINEKSRANDGALQLVKLLCSKLKSVGNSDNARSIYAAAILNAAKLGDGDVVQTLLAIFPYVILSWQDASAKTILHIAVENRSHDVYNLIYQMSDYKHLFSGSSDKNGNSLLHFSAKLAPSYKLDEISGAALQMQRELQWFKVYTTFYYVFTFCFDMPNYWTMQ